MPDVVDAGAFAVLAGHMQQQRLAALIDAYQQAGTAHVRGLAEAHRSGDLARLRAILHQMAASTGIVGAETLRCAILGVQHEIHAGRLPSGSDVQEVARLFAQSILDLRRHQAEGRTASAPPA